MQEEFKTTAPAKINLSLSVGPPVPSKGMLHPIASWMTTLDFCDDVCITRLDTNDLSRYAVLWHEDAPQKTTINWPITSDLTVRAHRSLEAEVGRSLPIQLKLEKRIPVGAGLGGGSSDAAATLRGLKALFQLDVDIHAIGASLGSDIPFLIDGGSQVVTGFGEQMESFPEVQRAIVLILPPYGCSTGEVYDAFDELCGATLDEERVRDGVIFNELTAAATEISEELSRDMAKIKAVAEVEVHLSGSGSSMFVICDNVLNAEALTLAIKEKTGLVAIAANTMVPNFSSQSGNGE